MRRRALGIGSAPFWNVRVSLRAHIRTGNEKAPQGKGPRRAFVSLPPAHTTSGWSLSQAGCGGAGIWRVTSSSEQAEVIAVAAGWAASANAGALAARQPHVLFRSVADFVAWAERV
jgi:hypothetical protein